MNLLKLKLLIKDMVYQNIFAKRVTERFFRVDPEKSKKLVVQV